MSERRHIFLSYRSSEADFALKLAADLKNAGVNLWMDRLDINPGDDWRKSLEGAVYSCAALISVLSPAYVSSKYCQRELARADRLGRPIFPVLLGTIPESDWPLEIERQQYIDFSSWQEEVAYQKQLNRLVDILKEKFADQISVIPDPETQYLTHLAAAMETQKGLAEYLEFSTDADKWLNRDFMRPEPHSIKFWTSHSTFTLLQSSPLGRYYRKRQFKELDEILDRWPRVVLIGDPGSGKTTTLRRLVLDAVYTYQTASDDTVLPLLLDLVTWDDQVSLDDFIRSRWPLDTDPIKLMARGSVVLYLDGLNEMSGARAEKARILRDWLTSENGPQKAIITCRRAEYDHQIDLALPVVLICDMDRALIERFSVNYLGEDLSRIFLAHILPKNTWEEQHKEHLYQLARNPFLLSAMILLHKSSPYGDVPDNIGMLLKSLVLEIWERERLQPVMPEITFEELETALSDLAFAVTESASGLYVSQSFALENLGSEAIYEAARRIGFIEVRAGNVRFSQQLIQDYFAALAVARSGLAAALSAPQVGPGGQYSPGPWDQAVVIYAGITQNTDETLLEIADSNPFLALECIANGIDASEHIVEPIIGKLIHIANTPDSDARVATASILGRINHDLAIPILLEAMRDGSWDVRWAATLALQAADVPLLGGLTDVLWELEHDIQEAANTAVRQLGPNALPTLLKLLQNENWKMRRSAAWALGRVRDRAAVPGLVQALYDEDNLVGAEAAASLGEMRDSVSIPWLVETLRHANWRVRKAAAQALGTMGTLALNHLLDTMKDPEEDVRRLAIEAIKEIDDPAVTEALLDASYDRSAEVRGAALDAMRDRADDVTVERLIECLADKSRTRWNRKRICDIAARSLAGSSAPDAQVALRQWQKEEGIVTLAPKPKNLPVRASAQKLTAEQAKQRLKRITRTNEVANAKVVAQATPPPPPEKWETRRDNILALKGNNTPSALFRLELALDDDVPQVRAAAVDTLATLDDPAALDTLATALQDDDREVLAAVTSHLKAKGSAAVPALVEMLTSDDIALRARVVDLLGQIGDPSAIPYLQPLLTSDDIAPQGQPFREMTARVLQVLSAAREQPGAVVVPIQPPKPEKAPSKPEVTANAVVPVAAPVAPKPAPDAPKPTQVIHKLAGPQPATPIVQADPALPASPQPPVRHRDILGELLDALHKAEWGDRENAAKALRDYAKTLHGTRDKDLVERLGKEVGDTDWVIRWASAEALAWIGDPAAVPLLVKALNDSYWMVRIAVVRALLEINEPSAAADIAKLLTDSHSTVREAVVEALGVLGNVTALPSLTTALSDQEPLVRLAATNALGRIADKKALKPLTKALKDKDSYVRWAAVSILGERGEPEMVPALIDRLKDSGGPYWEELKIDDLAAAALLRLATPEAKAAVDAWQSQRVAQS